MNHEEINAFLPVVFQRTIYAGNPAAVFLAVMEILHAPSETILADVDRFFDPRRTPDSFVMFLAQWVNLDRVFGADIALASDSPQTPKIGYQRELVANAIYLSKWRGTKRGLLLFLQTATGEKKFEIDERARDDNGQPLPFHLKIQAPRASETQAELIKRIIESEKPAHMTYELLFS